MRAQARRRRLAVAAVLAGLMAPALAAAADVATPPPNIEATAAFLVQAQSGAVLYEKDAFVARPPASLTKMVTALVVLDRCALDDLATVTATAAAAGGSEIGLRPGETIAVRELLKGLMLPSGNDAAACLAEHVAGSQSAFAELMNAKAAELGAVNTHFVNPSGLTAEGHYSCARDLAVFGLAVRLQPFLAEIIRQPSATVHWSSGRSEAVANLNRLLSRCQGCDGVKTGFTTPAGRCLAASAERDGYALMCVVLKSPDSWTESGALLNWGFSQPPLGVVEVHNPLANDRLRIPSPIIDDRLHVPPDDLLRYLGCTVHAEGATVTARLADRQLRFSEVEGLSIEGGETRPELAGRLWRARLVVPAAELCRFLGLSLRFDKPTLTATVGQ